jgi:hypothetical protein
MNLLGIDRYCIRKKSTHKTRLGALGVCRRRMETLKCHPHHAREMRDRIAKDAIAGASVVSSL